MDDVLDYDYAPISVLVCHKGISKMVWMNVSQECLQGVDDFIAKGLCRNIKLQSRDFSAVTAFQITEKGLNFLVRQVLTHTMYDAFEAVFTFYFLRVRG